MVLVGEGLAREACRGFTIVINEIMGTVRVCEGDIMQTAAIFKS